MATKLNEISQILKRNYEAGVNCFLTGKPGIGKTQTIEAFCASMTEKDPDFGLWEFYAPTMSPMDIQASAPDYETGTLRLFNNAALPNAYVDPDARGCIFLGELPSADPATAKLLQKYINGEDMSGVLRKPLGVMVVADGNRLEDKSGVQSQGRALMSRFEQLEVYVEAKDAIDYASANSWHPTVQLFFKDNPALIDNYDEVFETSASVRSRSSDAKAASGPSHLTEEGKRGIWASMRSWERISKKEYAAEKLGGQLSAGELAGNLGQGVAAQYTAHKCTLDALVSYDEIIKAPTTVTMPARMDEQYQLAVIVALKATEGALPAIYTFAQRMPRELQVVVLRTILFRRNRKWRLETNPVYGQWIKDKDLFNLICS